MSKTNVGANLVFARRTKTFIKPMFESEFETFASGIGLQTIVVRRANTRFAPTLVSDIAWISITTIYPKIYDRLLSPFSAHRRTAVRLYIRQISLMLNITIRQLPTWPITRLNPIKQPTRII
jgi:hypothetical protein